MIKVLIHFTSSWTPLIDNNVSNWKEYCRKNQYELCLKEVNQYKGYTGIEKIDQIKEELKDRDIGLVMDADAIFTNMKKRVEDFIDGQHDLFLCNDINGINTGVFIVRWSEWSQRMFTYFRYLIEHYSEIECEQNAIRKYLDDNPNDAHIKMLSHPLYVNAVPYDFYSPSYGKWGYKDGDIIEKPTVNQGAWIPGSYIMHLPGKTIEERISIINQTPIEG